MRENTLWRGPSEPGRIILRVRNLRESARAGVGAHRVPYNDPTTKNYASISARGSAIVVNAVPAWIQHAAGGCANPVKSRVVELNIAVKEGIKRPRDWAAFRIRNDVCVSHAHRRLAQLNSGRPSARCPNMKL
jgi:hypothetical protein